MRLRVLACGVGGAYGGALTIITHRPRPAIIHTRVLYLGVGDLSSKICLLMLLNIFRGKRGKCVRLCSDDVNTRGRAFAIIFLYPHYFIFDFIRTLVMARRVEGQNVCGTNKMGDNSEKTFTTGNSLK